MNVMIARAMFQSALKNGWSGISSRDEEQSLEGVETDDKAWRSFGVLNGFGHFGWTLSSLTHVYSTKQNCRRQSKRPLIGM
jgi:hypothetical protein